MNEIDQKILELEARLDILVRGQIEFQVEVTAIRNELARLGDPKVRQAPATDPPPTPPRPPQYQDPPPRAEPPPAYTRPEPAVPPPSFGYQNEKRARAEEKFNDFFEKHTEGARSNLERFIGENLISKIGILILIIGVGIGVKYSIDNDLISPLTRIVLGYVFGVGLVGLALKLKAKYHNFSAVLMSGGMATMYFVTYFAYSLYGLFPQPMAFGLMALFTFLAIGVSIFYDRQVVAHIGLVGAYAVPFLLSNDSGNYLFLFIYMAILNGAILAVSLRKSWTSLFYTASLFTWLIYGGWFAAKYIPAEHFGLGLTFLGIFFAIFYAMRILRLRFKADESEAEDVAALVGTVGVYFLFLLAIASRVVAQPQLWVLFSFIAVSAIVILATSHRSVGKWLIYLVYPATWLIYLTWFLDRYEGAATAVTATIFATIFFAIFYITALTYRLLREDFSLVENAACVLTNSFIFYGVGYRILDWDPAGGPLLGLYTVGHGLLHLIVAQFVSRFKPAAGDIVHVLTILILTFGTIAVPVQFDGNFVTMVWAVEAALLFWMGRSRKLPFFEYASYPVMFLAAASMLADWATAIGEVRQPILNGDLVTALVVAVSFGFIFFVNEKKNEEPAISPDLLKPFSYLAGTIAVMVVYNAFRLEIGNYFEMKILAAREAYLHSRISDIGYANFIWQINYTLFFLSVLGLINLYRGRSRSLALVHSILTAVTLGIFATFVMIVFNMLRLSFLRQHDGVTAVTHLGIRYVSYVFAAVAIYVLYRNVRDKLLDDWIPSWVRLITFEAVFYVFLFIVASGELVFLMEQFYIADATKLGLSIFWGIYALVLVVLGIAWDKKHLRIAAIVLLAVTLAKLFFYDITELGTIPKTILFVTLGMTLLLISFLYNKYKEMIFPTAEAREPEPVEGSVKDI